MGTLRDKTIHSVFWSGIERFSVQGVQFVISLLIARVLLPSDYGLIAMLGIFLAIAQSFVDSGFCNALIQKKERSQADYSTVFYFNIVIACIVYGLLWLAAPAIARFYEEPQLIPVTRVIGLTIIVNSFAIVQQAQLTIKLNFKLQAILSLVSVIISGFLGIWMAQHAYGVWALVAQTLLNRILNVGLLWIYGKWLPALCFSMDSFRVLFSFGSKLLLSGLLHTIYTNLYSLVIGKKYSATDLGFYNRAFSFTNVVSANLINVIVRAIYPIQCSIQDDVERLRNSFFKYIRFSCFIIFPLMTGMFVLAKPLILFLLTEKWLFSADLLQIMCLAYMWEILMNMNYTLLNVKGRTDYTLKSEIYKKIVAFVILFVTLPFGLKVLCWGLLLYSWVDLLIVTQYTKKLLGIGLWEEVKTIFPVLVLSVAMGGIVWLVTYFIDSSLWKLITGGITGVVSYLGLSVLFRFDEYVLAKKFIQRKL